MDNKCLDNSNLTFFHLGQKGLHRSNHGTKKMALNIISLIKRLYQLEQNKDLVLKKETNTHNHALIQQLLILQRRVWEIIFMHYMKSQRPLIQALHNPLVKMKILKGTRSAGVVHFYIRFISV